MGDTNHSDYCGVGIRGVATGIDSFVWLALLFVAIFAVGAATGQLETGTQGVNADLTGDPAAAALGLWCALAFGYHTVFEWLFGKTIGKRLVRIRVTDTDGSSLTLGRSLIRNLLRPVDMLPVLYLVGVVGMVVSDRQQRVGDRLAGTTVVRT